MRPGLWAGLFLLFVGCARPGLWKPDVPPTTPDELTAGLPGYTGDEMKGSNAVEVVNNGEVFALLDREIRQATSSVHIELFIWRPGKASKPMVEALRERAAQGVACRIVIDPLESPGFKTEVLPELTAAGCDVRIYKPIFSVTRLKEKLERNHRKIVVIDGNRAITGGFGVHDSWLGDAKNPKEWRDISLFARGPVVRQFQEVFAEDWVAAGGRPLPPEAFPDLAPAGKANASVVSSSGMGPNQADAERATQLLIWSARSRLWIANSYFVPSDDLIDALVRKVKEGVDVRVLVPGDIHDMALIFAGQRDSYRALIDGGVQIFEYRPTMLHSKLILVDDRLAFVGSTNFDPLALRCVKEASLLVDDPDLVASLAADFEEDLTQTKRVGDPPLALGPVLARNFLWNFVAGVACQPN